jgi:hypothetical protein
MAHSFYAAKSPAGGLFHRTGVWQGWLCSSIKRVASEGNRTWLRSSTLAATPPHNSRKRTSCPWQFRHQAAQQATADVLAVHRRAVSDALKEAGDLADKVLLG